VSTAPHELDRPDPDPEPTRSSSSLTDGDPDVASGGAEGGERGRADPAAAPDGDGGGRRSGGRGGWVGGVPERLGRVVAGLPGGGEARPGQIEMAERVAESIRDGRHLVVRAGTGTGKTLAYLVPAVLSGQRVVVATATRALQDQLAGKDLPFLHRHLDRPFDWAVLKGRSNYVCVQRLAEAGAATGVTIRGIGRRRARSRDAAPETGAETGAGATASAADSYPATTSGSGGDTADDAAPVTQLALDGLSQRADRRELAAIAAWAATTEVGDKAELEVEPSDATWAAVSTTSRDCPGARRCPRGDACFAERARERAQQADVVVVNLHLYGLDLASGGQVLPEHDLAVIDEAHVLDDVISATCGIEVGPGRFTHLARLLRGILTDAGTTLGDLESAGGLLSDAIESRRGERLVAPLPDDVATALATLRERVMRAHAALSGVPDDAPDDATARAVRARLAATALADELDRLGQPTADDVVWVEDSGRVAVLRLAPLDVAGLLRARLWDQRPAVLTSATIAAGFGTRVGLPPGSEQPVDVGSPFDYARNALIYCNPGLPPPTSPKWADAAIDELALLIEAAGGRTLALFTSYRAMGRAADALAERLPYPVLSQGDLPKARLLERFSAEPETCLFATTSFWQGVDVPGPSLSLVTIDRLPFPRPDEPLLQARREQLGAQAFLAIDVPRAATMLAQGVGRLIRTSTDRGAVAVLDPRLATARYGPKIVAALPKMRRTRRREEALAFLRSLR
jgi:ATP-dependent DNA helicase DinG